MDRFLSGRGRGENDLCARKISKDTATVWSNRPLLLVKFTSGFFVILRSRSESQEPQWFCQNENCDPLCGRSMTAKAQ
jgi:hypothetical protein